MPEVKTPLKTTGWYLPEKEREIIEKVLARDAREDKE